MERGDADNLQTRIRESSVGAASPGLAHDSTVRHDVVVENRWPFECTLYLTVTCAPKHVPLAYPQGLVWTEEKDARRRGRVAFREDLTVGTPTNTALLPYSEDLVISTAVRRKDPGAPKEPGAHLTHAVKIV